MATKKVITNNREIYDKLNMLLYLDEVTLDEVKYVYINRIIKNVNNICDNKVLELKTLNGNMLIKKLLPFNVNIYYKK